MHSDEMAVILAKLSRASYFKKEQLPDEIMAKFQEAYMGFDEKERLDNIQVTVIEAGNNTRLMVVSDNDKMVVIARGTVMDGFEPDITQKSTHLGKFIQKRSNDIGAVGHGLRNSMKTANIMPEEWLLPNFRMHGGHLDALHVGKDGEKSAYVQFKEHQQVVNEMAGKELPIFLSGHSLGGGLCIEIVASLQQEAVLENFRKYVDLPPTLSQSEVAHHFDMSRANPLDFLATHKELNIAGIYTQAAPPVLDKQAYELMKPFEEITHHYRRELDAVPAVFPRFLEYKQSPGTLHFFPKKGPKVENPERPAMGHHPLVAQSPSTIAYNHGIESYITVMEAHASDEKKSKVAMPDDEVMQRRESFIELMKATPLKAIKDVHDPFSDANKVMFGVLSTQNRLMGEDKETLGHMIADELEGESLKAALSFAVRHRLDLYTKDGEGLTTREILQNRGILDEQLRAVLAQRLIYEGYHKVEEGLTDVVRDEGHAEEIATYLSGYDLMKAARHHFKNIPEPLLDDAQNPLILALKAHGHRELDEVLQKRDDMQQERLKETWRDRVQLDPLVHQQSWHI